MSQLVEVLHDPRFDWDSLKRIMKNLKEYEEVFCKSTKESTKDDVFQTVLVKQGVGSNEVYGTLYVKNIRKIFQK